MICRKCGKEVPDSAHFCAFCGEPLSICPTPTEISDSEKTSESVETEKMTIEEPTADTEGVDADAAAVLNQPTTDGAPTETDAPTAVMTEPVCGAPSENEARENEAQAAPVYGEAQNPTIDKTDCKPAKPTERVPIGLRILSAFLCIVLFALSVSASCVGIARGLLTEDKLLDMMSRISLSDLEIDGESLAEKIYDSCDSYKIQRYHLTERKIEKLLDDIDVDSALRNLALPYLQYILGETSRFPDIDAEDIIREVKRNEKVIRKTLNYQLSDADYDVMERELNAALENLDLEKTLDTVFPEIARALTRYIAAVYGIMIALSIVFLLLVFICNRMALHESSLHLMITFFACALSFGGACIGLIGYFVTTADFEVLIRSLLTPCAIRAGGYLLIGALFLVLYIVSGKRRRSEKKAARKA